MNTRLGRMLRAYRERNAMTCADLATKSGVSERQIHRIERGESMPKAGTLAKFAAAFNTDAASFRLGLDNEELEDLVQDLTCACCGARLTQRVDVPHEYGDDVLDVFECGATRGWESRPCPRDPRFPRFEDYELSYFAEEDTWWCIAHGRTREARLVSLQHGHGSTREVAARWVQRSYISARDGHTAAEQAFPMATLMDPL
jgi:transcriptional regulator with XRE-family HTH domain